MAGLFHLDQVCKPTTVRRTFAYQRSSGPAPLIRGGYRCWPGIGRVADCGDSCTIGVGVLRQAFRSQRADELTGHLADHRIRNLPGRSPTMLILFARPIVPLNASGC